MPRILVVVLLVSIAETLGAQHDSMLDAPVSGPFRVVAARALDPCGIFTVVEQIARQANVRVGVEHAPGCRGFTRSNEACDSHNGDVQNLDGWTARQAFDYVLGLNPVYRWKVVDDVIVVRPASVWGNGGHVLSRRVPAFELADVHLRDVLDRVLKTAEPALFYPYSSVAPNGRPIDRLVSLAFPGGTVMEALNAAARAHGNTIWLLHYGQPAHVEFFPRDWSMGAVGAPLAVSAAERQRARMFAERTGVPYGN